MWTSMPCTAPCRASEEHQEVELVFLCQKMRLQTGSIHSQIATLSSHLPTSGTTAFSQLSPSFSSIFYIGLVSLILKYLHPPIRREDEALLYPNMQISCEPIYTCPGFPVLYSPHKGCHSYRAPDSYTGVWAPAHGSSEKQSQV